LQVYHVQLSLRSPTVGSLNDPCDKINAAPFMPICIGATECDRLSATSVNHERQTRMAPVADQSNLLKCNGAEEEEWVRVANPRRGEVVG
jgi:hypothetical protein